MGRITRPAFNIGLRKDMRRYSAPLKSSTGSFGHPFDLPKGEKGMPELRPAYSALPLLKYGFRKGREK
jgi:hypothetical protein